MTAVSKSQAKTDIAATFTDNIVGAITPTGTRNVLDELVDSWVDTLLPGASTGTMVYWADATSPTALTLGSRASILSVGANAPSWITGIAGQAVQVVGGSVAWTNAISITAPSGAIGLAVTASAGDGAYLQLTGASANLQLGEVATGGVLKLTSNFGQLDFGTSNTTRFTISNDGSFYCFGATPEGNGTFNAAGIFDNGRRVFNSASSPLTLSASGVGGITGPANTVLGGVGGAAQFGSQITLGIAGSSIGTLALAGSSSGSVVTLAANPSGTTWTMQLASSGGTNGFILQTNGSGVTNWVNGSQIPGTTTNDAASAGNIGEYITSTRVAGSAITVSSLSASNITSISLTAGDWDVFGGAGYNGTSSFTPTFLSAVINNSSATPVGIDSSGLRQLFFFSGQTFTNYELSAGYGRMSFSTTTSVFLIAHAQFGAGSASAYGFLGARRRR